MRNRPQLGPQQRLINELLKRGVPINALRSNALPSGLFHRALSQNSRCSRVPPNIAVLSNTLRNGGVRKSDALSNVPFPHKSRCNHVPRNTDVLSDALLRAIRSNARRYNGSNSILPNSTVLSNTLRNGGVRKSEALSNDPFPYNSHCSHARPNTAVLSNGGVRNSAVLSNVPLCHLRSTAALANGVLKNAAGGPAMAPVGHNNNLLDTIAGMSGVPGRLVVGIASSGLELQGQLCRDHLLPLLPITVLARIGVLKFRLKMAIEAITESGFGAPHIVVPRFAPARDVPDVIEQLLVPAPG
jgi:hypothetical protein